MVLLHNFSSLTFYSLMNKFTCIILFQPNNKLIILPNVNFAHYFQLPDEETKVWGYLNNLSLICSFIHFKNLLSTCNVSGDVESKQIS